MTYIATPNTRTPAPGVMKFKIVVDPSSAPGVMKFTIWVDPSLGIFNNNYTLNVSETCLEIGMFFFIEIHQFYTFYLKITSPLDGKSFWL